MRDKLYAVVIVQQISQVASIQSVRISVACSWQHMVLSLLHRPCKTLSQLPSHGYRYRIEIEIPYLVD